MSEGRTEISSIGEFGLIHRIEEKLEQYQDSTILGVGDDAAVISGPTKNLKILSSDMLLEGIHFDLSYVPLQHLGYKAIAVNVSDIAAMNGQPRQITINLALSNRFSVEAVEALYEGFRAAAKDYQVDIVGGDTTASGAGLVISVSILGDVTPDLLVKRSTAEKDDIICVTGDLGGAYAGLQVLEREKQEYLANPEMQPNLEKYDYVVGRQLRPRARMDIIHELASLGLVPTAMIDISDGLVSDLFHICERSGVGAALYEDKLPISEQTYATAAEFAIDPNTCALNGGEDYELLFTIKQDHFEKIKNHEDIQTIGYIHEAEKGRVLVTRNQNVVPLEAQGWAHFKQ
ncbi:MAG: thiamine-phosphate kinase [Bacteroidota bacterium]